MSDVQTTRLGRNWLLKTLVFMVVLLGFGAWGLGDALYFYPRRGRMDAAVKLKNYLAAAEAAAMLNPAQVKVEDPRAALQALRAREADIKARSKSGESAAKVEEARREWLDSLNRMWALRPDPQLVHEDKGPPVRRIYFDPRAGEGVVVAADGTRARMSPRELETLLVNLTGTSNPVSPLTGYDLLMQWVFVVIGFGGGAWMLATLLRAASKRFAWDPSTQTLTMADGRAVTPADIQELDKRLWHKFFVVMSLKDGSSYKLDLLRYQPLEDWILEMERTAFPDHAEPGEPAAPVETEAGAG